MTAANVDLLQVYLISTKAGSVGINLTAAFRMIIYDELWNPVHNAQVITLRICSRLSKQCVHHLLILIEDSQHDEIVVLQLNHDLQNFLNHTRLSPVVTHQWQHTDIMHSTHLLSGFVYLSYS